MRGPRGRVRYVVRRTWQCPVCGRRVVTSGKVVHLACTCPPEGAANPTWMLLVDEPRPRRQPLWAEPPL
jgi:hypothetical protein